MECGRGALRRTGKRPGVLDLGPVRLGGGELAGVVDANGASATLAHRARSRSAMREGATEAGSSGISSRSCGGDDFDQ